jgi:hypothetical protein
LIEVGAAAISYIIGAGSAVLVKTGEKSPANEKKSHIICPRHEPRLHRTIIKFPKNKHNNHPYYHLINNTMNQFVQRVVNYIANELFIKGLAESKTFQRFAVHTDRHIQKFKKDGVEQLNSKVDELHKEITKAAYSTSTKSSGSGGGGSVLQPPQKPMEGIPGFFNALGRVIRRDLGIDKK